MGSSKNSQERAQEEQRAVSATFDILEHGECVAARERNLRLASLGAGLVLIGLARLNPGRLRVPLAIGGSVFVFRGVSGQALLDTCRWILGQMPRQTHFERLFGKDQRDVVDEGSWQSFPASDASSFAPEASKS